MLAELYGRFFFLNFTALAQFSLKKVSSLEKVSVLKRTKVRKKHVQLCLSNVMAEYSAIMLNGQIFFFSNFFSEENTEFFFPMSLCSLKQKFPF
jgi:hypothetical protein